MDNESQPTSAAEATEDQTKVETENEEVVATEENVATD